MTFRRSKEEATEKGGWSKERRRTQNSTEDRDREGVFGEQSKKKGSGAEREEMGLRPARAEGGGRSGRPGVRRQPPGCRGQEPGGTPEFPEVRPR